EGHLRSRNNNVNLPSSRFVYQVGAEVTRGREMRVCNISTPSRGTTTLIVKIKCDAVVSGSLTVFLENALLSRLNIENGLRDHIIINTIPVAGERTLRIVGDENVRVTVETVEVILIGASRMTSHNDLTRADSSDGVMSVVSSWSNRLFFQTDQGRTINAAVAGSVVGVGQVFDVLSLNATTTYIVYSDLYDNLFCVRALRQGASFNFQRRFLGRGGQSLAICSHQNNLIIAFVRGNETGFLTVSHDLRERTNESFFENPESITSVTFIKNSRKPMLILANSERSFLRNMEESTEARGTVRVNVSVAIVQ
ncbi:MAG: hypothetical protein FWC11_01065, partial [Firmicutes bacterium]|nr:hypothetical protein [Bacillota bacterium]